MSITVRPLAPADRALWDGLWRAYLDFYKTELPADIYDLKFARMLNPDPRDGFGLVAVRDGRLVGLVHYIFHVHGWRAEDVVYLQDLFTHPDVRGMGAGRMLIEAVYSAADAAGCPTVYWNTQHFNEAGRRLYDKVATKTDFIKYQR